MYRSDRALYGRHWGCIQQIDALHFEVCYYQGIEYCIEHGLELFRAGAQGEHKLARDFFPHLPDPITGSSMSCSGNRSTALLSMNRKQSAIIYRDFGIFPYRRELSA